MARLRRCRELLRVFGRACSWTREWLSFLHALHVVVCAHGRWISDAAVWRTMLVAVPESWRGAGTSGVGEPPAPPIARKEKFLLGIGTDRAASPQFFSKVQFGWCVFGLHLTQLAQVKPILDLLCNSPQENGRLSKRKTADKVWFAQLTQKLTLETDARAGRAEDHCVIERGRE